MTNNRPIDFIQSGAFYYNRKMAVNQFTRKQTRIPSDSTQQTLTKIADCLQLSDAFQSAHGQHRDHN